MSYNQTTSSYIPQEAYLYFPKTDNSRKANTQRVFFDGNTQFTSQEHEMINKFRVHSEKQNYTLKSLWTDNMILRFLYANNFKMSNTLTSVQEHTIWRETTLPVQVDEPLQKVLNSGLLYVHGRDQEFRPIVVFNVYQLDPKKVDVELITRALTFWFEYVINEYMLPGQIENWVFIADVKGMGVGTLMLPSIRKLFGYLQDNYKCRLHTLYILNVTTTLYAPWQVIKKFLDEVTVKKIQICKGTLPVGLLNFTNSEQVEEKYGGSAPNATQFWPPVVPSNNYFMTPKDSEALVSEEQYMSLYKSGSLKNMRVDQERVKRNSQSDIEEDELPALQLVSSSSGHLSPEPLNYLDESMNDADYLECMNETTKFNQIEIMRREFQSSFLTTFSSH